MYYCILMVDLKSLNRSLQIFPRTLDYLKLTRIENHNTEKLKLMWANEILQRLNIHTEVINSPKPVPGTLFLGNHISYVDIPLLIQVVPDICFVAKKEIRQWPIIGPAAEKINTVFIDRSNKLQRLSVRESIYSALTMGQKVALFPSGTTCMDESVPWRKGAFELAQQGNFSIQPFRIRYNPLREVAYIDKDILIFHLLKLSQIKFIQATIEFHDPVQVKSVEHSCADLQKWTQEGLSGSA